MTLPDNTEPSAEARQAAHELLELWTTHVGSFARFWNEVVALALDRFRAAERERPTKFLAWAVEMFGPVALEPRERALRFVEEAVELAHATGVDAATLSIISERVYSRPAGDPTKEAAQSLACLECLALVLGVDLEKEADAELARVQAIPRAEWVRRHAAKVAAGFAGASPMTEESAKPTIVPSWHPRADVALAPTATGEDDTQRAAFWLGVREGIEMAAHLAHAYWTTGPAGPHPSPWRDCAQELEQQIRALAPEPREPTNTNAPSPETGARG